MASVLHLMTPRALVDALLSRVARHKDVFRCIKYEDTGDLHHISSHIHARNIILAYYVPPNGELLSPL
jgi:hypothetical protein